MSRRLPDENNERGQKRSSEGAGDIHDQRESISRRLPDDDGQPAPVGPPQALSPDMAGAVERRKVKWTTDVGEFEAQSTWEGARRDMVVVRRKLGYIAEIERCRLSMRSGPYFSCCVPSARHTLISRTSI